MRRRAAEPRRRERDDRRRSGGAGRAGAGGAPVSSYTSWEPPQEEDDERPILGEEEDTTSPLPRYTVEGDAPDEGHKRGETDRGERDGDRRESEEGFVQLFVNVGKREGVRASELQRMLTDKGLGEQEIGRIRVRDRMSFIGVKREAFERAAAALSGQVVGGRTIVAELARGRA
jgi:ATP-dependent RNA helicase DeaD